MTALLWDLDNVTTKRQHLPHLAAVLAAIAGPNDPKIASGRRSTALQWEHLLNECGFETRSGGRSKSGADRQLILGARHLYELGTRSFLVATNDGDLARIARWGDLHVVTLNRSAVSRRLVRCAASILVLAPEVSRPDSPPPLKVQQVTDESPEVTEELEAEMVELLELDCSPDGSGPHAGPS